MGKTCSAEINYLDISKVSDQDFKNIADPLTLFGVEDKNEILPFVYRKHILGKWLMLKMLKSYGISDDALKDITTTKFGKPFIHSVISFNISHSNDLIVCAVANTGEVGIDLEYVRSLDYNGYQNLFSAEDWQQISSNSNPSYKLLDLWTKKESLLKADGRGLQVPMADVHLYEHYGVIKDESRQWYIKKINIAGYCCHMCTEFPVEEIKILEVQL